MSYGGILMLNWHAWKKNNTVGAHFKFKDSITLGTNFGTDFRPHIITMHDPRYSTYTSFKGTPNITTIHFCSMMCGKKP